VQTLVFDKTYGTALQVAENQTTPVAWPPGYTSVWTETEVTVFDASGKLVAVTGKPWRYWYGANVNASTPGWVGTPLPDTDVMLVCSVSPPF